MELRSGSSSRSEWSYRRWQENATGDFPRPCIITRPPENNFLVCPLANQEKSVSFFFLSQRKPKKIVSGEKGLAHGKVNCVSNNSTLYSAIFLFYFIFLIFLILKSLILSMKGFPGGASGKEPACQHRRHRDAGWIPGLGRSPAGGHGHPLQYSCLENPTDRGAWRATVHGITKSWTWLKGFSME